MALQAGDDPRVCVYKGGQGFTWQGLMKCQPGLGISFNSFYLLLLFLRRLKEGNNTFLTARKQHDQPLNGSSVVVFFPFLVSTTSSKFLLVLSVSPGLLTGSGDSISKVFPAWHWGELQNHWRRSSRKEEKAARNGNLAADVMEADKTWRFWCVGIFCWKYLCLLL